jgi:thiamine-phosphate diphosphorylase
VDLIDLWADEGITFFQYRNKQKVSRSRLDEVERHARRRRMRWILNDYVQLFCDGAADGIHLGWEDWHDLSEELRQTLLQRLKGVLPLQAESTPICGISTHTVDQWSEALRLHRDGILPLSYIAFGPCFPTNSKKSGLYPVLSEEALKELERRRDQARKTGELPDTVFIGGIDPDNLPVLIKSLSEINRKADQTIFIASIRALSDPLEVRRFRSVPDWKP